MPNQNSVLAVFNRGRCSPLVAARVEEIKRVSLSAEIMTNWMPRSLGSMMLRPGLGWIGTVRSNALTHFIPFVFSTNDTALLELTDVFMRVWLDEEVISRPYVSTAITNGLFDANVTSWTDADEAGATSAWATGGFMSLAGNGTAAAKRRQLVAVAADYRGVEHALRIQIERGPVVLRVGSTSGGDEYISETSLGRGVHSLAFTPTGDFYVEFQNRRIPASLVDHVLIEGEGELHLPAPWLQADLGNIRGGPDSQSGDVIYVACETYQQRKIERRGARSWSIVRYEPEDGPFRIENVTPITLTASALTGDITLTASAPLFKEGMQNGLFRISSEGQEVSADISAENTFTDAIRVTGIGNARSITVSLSGTWSATVTLQRSFDEGASWIDVSDYTTNTATTDIDDLDNQIVHYRIGVKTGNYTSGTVEATLDFPLGSITGVVRITGIATNVSASAQVLTSLGGTTATDVWAEGAWSTYRGFPTSVCFYEGRLGWFGRNGCWLSVSDAFESFDSETEGDSGPISRTIGSGPVDSVHWGLPLQRLLLGAEGAEYSVRSSSLDEPLTPTNFNIKAAATQGSAEVAAARIDARGVFVQRSQTKLYELSFDGNVDLNDYSATDLTLLVPEIGEPSIVKIVVQRQPDTRVHCIRSDGTVALLIQEKAEKVLCWCDLETDGLIEDAVVLPGMAEDLVYYVVKRTIAAGVRRYLEKFALESECEGSTLNKQADSFRVITNSPANVNVPVGTHLEGESVICWADGVDYSPDNSSGVQQTYTVTGGAITLSTAVSQAVVGLPYDARWKNAKLSLAMALGTSLTQPKKIARLGIIAKNLHPKGVKFGPDFDNLEPLPEVERGTTVNQNTVRSSYDEPSHAFPGSWDTDSRLCLRARAPRPANVLACVMSVEGHDRY